MGADCQGKGGRERSWLGMQPGPLAADSLPTLANCQSMPCSAHVVLFVSHLPIPPLRAILPPWASFPV